MTNFIYTSQEAFDKVVEHLVKQGEPSLHGKVGPYDQTICAYKSSEGLMCAVGCLLPSTWRVKEYEDWSELAKRNTRYRKLANLDFLSDLQLAHDSPSRSAREDWRKNWYAYMLNIATKYKLDASKLKKLASKSWRNNS